MKKWPSLLSLFFVLIFPSSIYPQSAPLYHPAWAKVRQEVKQTLKSRDGVVIWRDLETDQEKVWGNPRLLKEEFLLGSVMKLLTAEAALQQGAHNHYLCEGHGSFKNLESPTQELQWCWEPNGHGRLNLPEALAYSCNLYFANLGIALDWQIFKQVLESYSFKANQKFLQNYSEKPPPLNLFAIGEVLGTKTEYKVTPEEVARFWQQYIKKLEQPAFSSIRQGLKLAGERGTGRKVLKGLKFKALIKTGTADSQRSDFKTHAWLLATYPEEKPRFSMVIFLKNAHAYEEAAILARKIMGLLYFKKS